jgi:hypothetical protein
MRRVLAGPPTCLLLLVASCGPALPAAPDADQIAGRVLSARDEFPLSLLPASSIGGGAVLAVPTDRADVLWEALERDPPGDVRVVTFRVDAETIHEAGGDLAEVADDGTFTLTADSGPHLFCYTPTDGPEHTVTDCVELELTSPGQVAVRIGMDLAVEQR